MAYDKEEIFKKAEEISIRDTIYFIADIISYLPVSTSTFYELFPAESEEMETIKKNLEDNKTNAKEKIRRKLVDGTDAAKLIAAYKLIGTSEERKKLSTNYHDHTSNEKELKTLTDTEREDKIKELKDKLKNIEDGRA